MPTPVCPHCDQRSAQLLEASRNAAVNYYHCEDCGHVWVADKQTSEILQHLTQIREPVSASKKGT